MADILFEKLKKEKQRQGALVNKIEVFLSDEELEIFNRKAEGIGLKSSDLLRVYLHQSGLFDSSVFQKKSDKKVKKVADKTVGNDEKINEKEEEK